MKTYYLAFWVNNWFYKKSFKTKKELTSFKNIMSHIEIMHEWVK